MNTAPTTWAELDTANKANGHYHRFDTLKPIALRSAERALELAKDNRALIAHLYDRGLAIGDDLIMAIEAEALIFNLKALLTDFWFIEINARDREHEAFRHGEIGYSSTGMAYGNPTKYQLRRQSMDYSAVATAFVALSIMLICFAADSALRTK